MKKSIIVLPLVMMTFASNSYADQLILDDLIVSGSHCVGFDCVNGESFGFDTIRLKENNLRIRFFDTSSTASFPSNDWQITANDSNNGGLNKFSIDDISGARTPFTIEAGAPSDSLYVEDGGRVGFGTSTPVVDLHAKTGNTPTLRLDQDGSSGFTPQTWDVAGNEANFFVRDATNGSTLPFRIRPGAPTSSIDIFSDKITVDGGLNMGFGTTSPDVPLHVQRDGSGAGVVLMNLQNVEGKARFKITSATDVWSLDNEGSFFNISKIGTGVNEFLLEDNGNLTIRGTLTQGSSRSLKEEIVPMDDNLVLAKLDSLELAEWQYKGNVERHVGPMAEDFHSTFKLGKDAQHIAPGDMAGVALAATKALSKRNTALSHENAKLSQENVAMKARLQTLETQMAELLQFVQHLQSRDKIIIAE